MTYYSPNFAHAIEQAEQSIRFQRHTVNTGTWQSIDVSNKPEMETFEIINYCLTVLSVPEDLQQLREEVRPNLPWADDHFKERVSGQPFNPGEQWKKWPWAHSADNFRRENGGKFSHSYMERYWPKWAENDCPGSINAGIRYDYGDLNDVVSLLAKLPNTRQAYLPVWFPEDTGVVHGERVPCTLGYQFLHRHGFLHISYFMRSCELRRHLRDDIYLTVRLQLWVLEKLKSMDSRWLDVVPGTFNMYIGSLHLFRNDYREMFGQ